MFDKKSEPFETKNVSLFLSMFPFFVSKSLTKIRSVFETKKAIDKNKKCI